jgi:hypothetical protein
MIHGTRPSPAGPALGPCLLTIWPVACQEHGTTLKGFLPRWQATWPAQNALTWPPRSLAALHDGDAGATRRPSGNQVADHVAVREPGSRLPLVTAVRGLIAAGMGLHLAAVWWWQVLGSNQRGLSRRFYIPEEAPQSSDEWPFTCDDAVLLLVGQRAQPLLSHEPP